MKTAVAASTTPTRISANLPRSWANQVYLNLVYWNEVERGGHFAALEVPDLFVTELRAFAPTLRHPA